MTLKKRALGIDYGTTAFNPAQQVQKYAAALTKGLASESAHLIIEPGRFIVAQAGALLTRVLFVKKNGSKTFVITDAGMNDLLRPSLYQAYHEITVIDAPAGKAEEAAGHALASAPSATSPSSAPVDVVGPNCESGDFLALDRTLPGAGPGALLAVLGAGAYGFGMSFQYNSRPRAAEVLMDGERYAVIRQRETADDLMRGERVDPDWRDA